MNIKQFETGGKRYRDITLRLQVAGVPAEQHRIQPDLEKVVADIPNMPTKKSLYLSYLHRHDAGSRNPH